MILVSFNEEKWKALIKVSGVVATIDRKSFSENNVFNNSTSLDSVDEIFNMLYFSWTTIYLFYYEKMSVKFIPIME